MHALIALSLFAAGAAPPPATGPDAGPTANVLLGEARAPDAKALLASYAKLFPESAALEVVSEGPPLVVRMPKLGSAAIAARASALDEADAAYHRSLSALLSDAPLPAHVAQLVVELRPEPTLSRVDAQNALARLSAAVADAHRATGVYFAAGKVLHPGDYAVRAARDKMPLALLWVGLDLGGTTARLALTSVGMARAGLMELQLTAQRAEIGSAIEMFYHLVALAAARGKDFPDGHRFEREGAAPLEVRYVALPDGKQVWRVDYP